MATGTIVQVAHTVATHMIRDAVNDLTYDRFRGTRFTPLWGRARSPGPRRIQAVGRESLEDCPVRCLPANTAATNVFLADQR